MITVIITAYKEEKTIKRAIDAVLNNKLDDFEIMVLAPDDLTLDVARSYNKKNIRAIKDEAKGKSAALNLGVKQAKGDILILTDGDVYVADDSLKKILSFFKDKTIGAVSGNPISLNPKNNMFGYWAYVLTSIASDRRIMSVKKNQRFFCSGYLFAIRKDLFPELPVDLLSEDGYISNNVYEKGFTIDYSEKSFVYIKYPTNFKDWIIQKKRSAGGYNQIKKLTGIEMRSFKTESKGGAGLLKYIKGPREFFYMFALFVSRVYLWILIYRDINLKKKSTKEIWQRVESTK